MIIKKKEKKEIGGAVPLAIRKAVQGATPALQAQGTKDNVTAHKM